jgi:hypothetical protein
VGGEAERAAGVFDVGLWVSGEEGVAGTVHIPACDEFYNGGAPCE